MLLALATQTVINAALLSKGRFHFMIYHPGKPVNVEVRLRSKNKLSDPWTYHENFRHMPKRVKTSPEGRRVFIVMPDDVGDYTQACARLAPQKSKAISNLSTILVEKYNGEVPEDMAALETLPGVGHKTASVVMSQGFGHPAFPVDTHIHRLAQRWGLTKRKSVAQTERDLKKLFPKQHWNKLHLQIIFYGREFCSARGCDGRVCDICTSCYPNRKNPFKANKA